MISQIALINDVIDGLSIRHWLWDINSMSKVAIIIVACTGLDVDIVIDHLMELSREMYNDPNCDVPKPENVQEIECIIDDLMNNPNSVYRQKYCIGQ